MKNISKIVKYLFVVAALALVSCETTELDLLDDPNSETQEKANLDRFMSQIQLDFASFMRQIGNNDAEVTRVNYMFGRTYANNYQPAVLDGEWATAYQGLFSDMAVTDAIAEGLDANKHRGIIRVLKAYTLITLVDNFGDVPFSQATNPVEFPAPVADPGANVYQGALAMLDEGLGYLSQTGDPLAYDLYYDNDFSKWTKLANTVKMVAYLNLGDYASFNAIANGPHINSNSDDFQFSYGSQEAQPDTRHPSYSSDYNVTGAGTYESVWLMNKMLTLDDPRIRYYYYRQTDCTPGASCDPDGNQTTLTCSVAPRPTHFPADMIFCSVEDGYWGRDHGNAEGIPPDGFQRTVNGVYPAGGRFDGDEFSPVAVGDGAGGAGIVPIMLNAWVKLMKAEVALLSGQGDASAQLSSALNAHISKVQSFGSLDPEANSDFFPSGGDVSNYVNGIVSSFNNGSASEKREILAEQVFIAHFGNGIGAYNFYRRVGYPQKLQYIIDPAEYSSGSFIRSFYYPANEANVNSNITQKPGVGIQVFWDQKPPSPGYPVAN